MNTDDFNAVYTIYTIAHPLTNEIVYVGCSSNFKQRQNVHTGAHRADTKIGLYIIGLREKYLLPKIEPIDFCEKDEAFFLERYWIHQLTAWGYELLNGNKTNVTTNYIAYSTNTRLKSAPIFRERTSKKWSVDDLKIGTVFTVAESKRNSFLTGFKAIARKYNKERYLSWKIKDGMAILKVVGTKYEVYYH